MNFKFITGLIVVLFFAPLLASGCIARDPVLPTLPDPSPTVPTLYPTQPPNLIPEVHLPQINDVDLNRQELPRYESLEIKLALDADYSNPYDVREVSLDGIFKAPDGSEMEVPGFWDGEEAWRFRFTPSQEGEWSYMLRISDHRGTSAPAVGQFRVTSTDLHGWLQLGSWINPDYSSRYFVHHDGTPFYGIGHCDPLNIMADGFSI